MNERDVPLRDELGEFCRVLEDRQRVLGRDRHPDQFGAGPLQLAFEPSALAQDKRAPAFIHQCPGNVDGRAFRAAAIERGHDLKHGWRSPLSGRPAIIAANADVGEQSADGALYPLELPVKFPHGIRHANWRPLPPAGHNAVRPERISAPKSVRDGRRIDARWSRKIPPMARKLRLMRGINSCRTAVLR